MEHHYEHIWLDPKFWVAVSFVIFFLLFGKRCWAALTNALDKRADQVRADLEEAASLRREAETMLRQAEADRKAALDEAAQILERARAEAQRVAEAATAEAEAAAKRRERMAQDRIAAAEAGAISEVREAVAEIATLAARKVIAERMTAERGAGLVDAAIAELPQRLRA
jgi:F-type H+-transporting ATPase subunit b